VTKRDFLTVDALSAAELIRLLDLADELKATRGPTHGLDGRSVGMIFEKPSTRTRVSFQVGIAELGGHPVVLGAHELQLGRGETIDDTARVLSRYLHALVVRTFEQSRLERLAAAGTIPVINALSDQAHPCQALADLQTIRERKGRLAGLRLAYLGDGNNVAHSLLRAGAMAGMEVRVATPAGYEPEPAVVRQAEHLAADTGAVLRLTDDPTEAARGADVLYADVWASMGQEAQAEQRADVFASYQINARVVDAADDDVLVLHCLPAHRGEEITDDVIDGPHSGVWDQAENRLHTQKALLLLLLT
jgi:ornithine carbamoyltransferase